MGQDHPCQELVVVFVATRAMKKPVRKPVVKQYTEMLRPDTPEQWEALKARGRTNAVLHHGYEILLHNPHIKRVTFHWWKATAGWDKQINRICKKKGEVRIYSARPGRRWTAGWIRFASFHPDDREFKHALEVLRGR